MMALKRLLVTVALSDLGLGLGGTEETVLAWLRRAAPKAHQSQTHLLRALPVTQGQRDERWNSMGRTQAWQAGTDGESTACSADGRQWLWSSCAPALRLILSVFVGPRTLARALQLIPMTAAVIGGVPCGCSDGFRGDLSARLEGYHTLKTWPRTGKPGGPKPLVKEPPPELVDGQGIKNKPKGRLQALVYRVRCGAQRLEALGLSISPSWLARLTLPLRQAFAPLSRQRGSGCKDRVQRRRRVVCLQAFSTCARSPMSVRVPLPEQAPHATCLIQPTWPHRTPGIAAGLTDHVGTFRELLPAKFEPLHSQSGSG